MNRDEEGLKRDILVISQYFYPEQFRINDICSEWIKKGYNVTVVTGIPNYPQGKFYKGYGIFKKRTEEYNGVKIIRLPLISRGNSSLQLLLNYLSFVLSGFWWSLFSKLKTDVVFIYEVSPMSQALPGIWYARKRKIPCYLYVTDLWPENVEIVAGIKNKLVLGLIGKMVDYIYKFSDRIFTSSESFIDAIEQRGVGKNKLEFWPQYAEDFYSPLDRASANINEIPADDHFNIIFAGNIGVAQGLHILPKVAARLKEKNVNVRFNIIGDGRYKQTLINMVEEYQVSCMFNFIGKQPSTRIPAFMAICDAALICLSESKVFSITLPAKTQSCLACGIPIIVSADGEVQKVINNAEAGFCSNAGNVDKLTENILKMISTSPNEREQMSQNALNYYNMHFNKEVLLNRMDKWLI